MEISELIDVLFDIKEKFKDREILVEVKNAAGDLNLVDPENFVLDKERRTNTYYLGICPE